MARCDKNWITKEEFTKRFFRDLKKKYINCKLVENIIEVEVLSVITLSINLDEVYGQYNRRLEPSYRIIKDRFFIAIEDKIEEYKKTIISSVIPVIKTREITKELDVIKDNFVLDLDIIYAYDNGEGYCFIGDEESFNKDEIVRNAFENIKNIHYMIERLDNDYEIYQIKSKDDITAVLLNINKQRHIINKLGKRFLIVIVNMSEILIAKDTPINIEVLRLIIELAAKKYPKEELMSDKIYRYNEGTFTYEGLIIKRIS